MAIEGKCIYIETSQSETETVEETYATPDGESHTYQAPKTMVDTTDYDYAYISIKEIIITDNFGVDSDGNIVKRAILTFQIAGYLDKETKYLDQENWLFWQTGFQVYDFDCTLNPYEVAYGTLKQNEAFVETSNC
jgi:hypothetical protein